MRIYTIYDRVAEEAGPIFSAGNDGVALREFNQLIAETFDKSDYKLLYLADFEPKECKLTVQVTPVEVTNYYNLTAEVVK